MKRVGLSPTRIAATVVTAFAVTGLAMASPANADTDTDFGDQLSTAGIYGQRDYNAWMGKITCKRLSAHVDPDLSASARFVSLNLPRGSTTTQAWQFVGAALNTYCPEHLPMLQRNAEPAG